MDQKEITETGDGNRKTGCVKTGDRIIHDELLGERQLADNDLRRKIGDRG